jgi:hypothetical protein
VFLLRAEKEGFRSAELEGRMRELLALCTSLFEEALARRFSMEAFSRVGLLPLLLLLLLLPLLLVALVLLLHGQLL